MNLLANEVMSLTAFCRLVHANMLVMNSYGCVYVCIQFRCLELTALWIKYERDNFSA